MMGHSVNISTFRYGVSLFWKNKYVVSSTFLYYSFFFDSYLEQVYLTYLMTSKYRTSLTDIGFLFSHSIITFFSTSTVRIRIFIMDMFWQRFRKRLALRFKSFFSQRKLNIKKRYKILYTVPNELVYGYWRLIANAEGNVESFQNEFRSKIIFNRDLRMQKSKLFTYFNETQGVFGNALQGKFLNGDSYLKSNFGRFGINRDSFNFEFLNKNKVINQKLNRFFLRLKKQLYLTKQVALKRENRKKWSVDDWFRESVRVSSTSFFKKYIPRTRIKRRRGNLKVILKGRKFFKIFLSAHLVKRKKKSKKKLAKFTVARLKKRLLGGLRGQFAMYKPKKRFFNYLRLNKFIFSKKDLFFRFKKYYLMSFLEYWIFRFCRFGRYKKRLSKGRDSKRYKKFIKAYNTTKSFKKIKKFLVTKKLQKKRFKKKTWRLFFFRKWFTSFVDFFVFFNSKTIPLHKRLVVLKRMNRLVLSQYCYQMVKMIRYNLSVSELFSKRLYRRFYPLRGYKITCTLGTKSHMSYTPDNLIFLDRFQAFIFYLSFFYKYESYLTKKSKFNVNTFFNMITTGLDDHVIFRKLFYTLKFFNKEMLQTRKSFFSKRPKNMRQLSKLLKMQQFSLRTALFKNYMGGRNVLLKINKSNYQTLLFLTLNLQRRLSDKRRLRKTGGKYGHIRVSDLDLLQILLAQRRTVSRSINIVKTVSMALSSSFIKVFFNAIQGWYIEEKSFFYFLKSFVGTDYFLQDTLSLLKDYIVERLPSKIFDFTKLDRNWMVFFTAICLLSTVWEKSFFMERKKWSQSFKGGLDISHGYFLWSFTVFLYKSYYLNIWQRFSKMVQQFLRAKVIAFFKTRFSMVLRTKINLDLIDINQESISPSLLLRYYKYRLDKFRTPKSIFKGLFYRMYKYENLNGLYVWGFGRFTKKQRAAAFIWGLGSMKRSNPKEVVVSGFKAMQTKFGMCGVRVMLSRKKSLLFRNEFYKNKSIMKINGY